MKERLGDNGEEKKKAAYSGEKEIIDKKNEINVR